MKRINYILMALFIATLGYTQEFRDTINMNDAGGIDNAIFIDSATGTFNKVNTNRLSVNITADSYAFPSTYTFISANPNNDYELNSTPSIVNGIDGQHLFIYNNSTAYSLSVKSDADGSNVRESFRLSPKKIVHLIYDSTNGYWSNVGIIDTIDYMDFNTSYTDGNNEGRLQWNTEDGTLEFGLPGGNVNLQIGQENLVLARNTTGSTITNGNVVYVSGASGSRPLISKAIATNPDVCTKILGIATENIDHNSTGYITTSGLVRDVSTSAYTAGTVLYLSQTTAGSFQSTPPTGTNSWVVVGIVLYSNSAEGIIYCNVNPIANPEKIMINSATISGASSTESTSTSVVGGIWNGDFNFDNSIDYTPTPGATYAINGLGLNVFCSGSSFNSTGTLSIVNSSVKVTSVYCPAGSYIFVRLTPDSSGSILTHDISPSTTYKLSGRIKTENITSGTVYLQAYILKSDGSYSNSHITNTITGNTDWNNYEVLFSSYSNAAKMYVQLVISAATGTAYFDDIKLEQVTTHTNNSTTPTVAYPVITGVSSEFVDQQQTTQDGTVGFGNIAGLQYWRKQTFTPTQSKLSAITLMKGASVGSPQGNVIIEIRNPADAIIASVDIEKTIWDTSWSTKNFPIFALVEKNAPDYSICIHSDINESTDNYYRIYSLSSGGYSGGQLSYTTNSGSSWTAIPIDLYFKTHYAENTRQITLTNSSTGTSTTVDWGDDGLPDGAVVDLYNGTMSWDSGTWATTGFSNLSKLFSVLYSIDSGGYSSIPGFFNSWAISGSYIYGNNAFAYMKIPSKNILSVTATVYYTNRNQTYWSDDAANWISAINTTSGTSASFIVYPKTNNLYLKTGYSGANAVINRITLSAALDTSKLAPLLLAAGSNTITQSVNGGSYKANVAIKSVSGGFQTTLNEANKQLTVLRNAPRSYLETPDKTQIVASTTNDAATYFNGQVSIGSYNPLADLHVEGNIYALGDMSAATFTDRTPAPPEDSLSQILKVSSKNGEIDHDTLGAAKVKRVQKISYVNVYSGTDTIPIAKIPTTLNENIINITEEVPEQIISATEAIELVTEEIPVLYDLEVTEVVKEITAPHSTVIKPEKIIKYKEKHYIKDMEKPLAVDDQYLEEDIYIDNAGDINFVVFPDAPAVETKDVIKKVTRTITLPLGEEIVETTTQEVIQLKPNVVQENDVYKIPSYTRIVGQRNLIKEKIEQEYNIPQEEIILQEQEVIEEVGNRDLGMSISMSIRSIQQLYSIIEELQTRIENLEGAK